MFSFLWACMKLSVLVGLGGLCWSIAILAITFVFALFFGGLGTLTQLITNKLNGR